MKSNGERDLKKRRERERERERGHGRGIGREWFIMQVFFLMPVDATPQDCFFNKEE
jgi:hypothetical protein